MKKLLILLSMAALIYSCGGGSQETESEGSASREAPKSMVAGQDYDTKRGEGKFKDFEPAATLDASLATKGEEVYNLKCASCHKLTDERLVGPGWKGVTDRQQGSWILNFITNTEEMLDKDPEAQAQLALCLVRMPNQNLTDEEAKAVYEYMRKNDGLK